MPTAINHVVFNRLHAAILAAEAAKETETHARVEALALIVSDFNSQTVKVDWGQLQPTRKQLWVFRSSAVTSAQREVDRLKKELKAAEKILKGAQDAAKAAGGAKARMIDETLSLRIVRGEEEA
jgi:hypothetical protein